MCNEHKELEKEVDCSVRVFSRRGTIRKLHGWTNFNECQIAYSTLKLMKVRTNSLVNKQIGPGGLFVVHWHTTSVIKLT